MAGDVESNPGPRGREPKPDKAKIMADKVEAHDAKFEELEKLLKEQSETIEAMKEKQVELEGQLEAKQVEAEARMSEMKVSLTERQEQCQVLAGQLEATQVQIDAEKERANEMAKAQVESLERLEQEQGVKAMQMARTFEVYGGHFNN